jgi:hypothetical protein
VFGLRRSRPWTRSKRGTRRASILEHSLSALDEADSALDEADNALDERDREP